MADICIEFNELQRASKMAFEDAVLHAALCYIKSGIHILPLEPNSKKLPSGGGINYLSATIKEHTVRKWFGPEGKYRGFNVGIATGIKGGVMALDIDSKPNGGTTGIKELARIVSKEGPLPPGPRQRTPSGGFHYLYLWQDNAINSSSKVANGIDTRGGNADRCTGHIVAFPSVLADKVYEWEEGGEVPPMPGWLSESMGEPWREKPKQDTQKVEIPINQINRMMTIIDPDSLSYEDWVKVGMALKTACGEDGLEIWDEWSRGGSRRKEGECQFRWKSFNPDGPVGFGTLLFMAKEAGWRPLAGDVSGYAIDDEIEERVLEMNKRYALVRANKSLMVATFEKNSGGVRVGFLSTQSFQLLAAPEKVSVPTRSGFSDRPLADLWMASPLRREYFDMGIYPQGDEPAGTLNTWNGWGVEPSSEKSCDRMLSHIRNIICSGDDSLCEWLLDWMADAVQDSRKVKGTCVVLRGVEGCGKGAWADTFGRLFGKHYTHLIDSERLTTKFNTLTSDSILVFADEVLWPGDRKAANVLKGMVTETKVVRESKGIDPVEMDSLMRVIIASNEEWIIPAGPESRRWLVLNVSGAVAKNKQYFDALFAEIEDGGMSALLHLLLHRKITSNLRTAPHTVGLTEQRRHSHKHDSLLHFLHEAVVRGGFSTMDVDAAMGADNPWPKKVLKYELFNEYRQWTNENRVTTYDSLNLVTFLGKIPHFSFIEEGKTLTVPSSDDLRRTIALKQGTQEK